MARSMALLMLAGLILMSFLPNHTVAQLRSMCLSQFALANQACAVLPAAELPRDLNQTNLQVAADSDDGDDDDDNDDNDGDGTEENERRRSRRTGNGHGQRQHGNGNGHRQRHRNGHGHRQRGGNGSIHRQRNGHAEEPRANRDCCRWLEEVDGSCVCTALLRLPPFLIKPKHEYSIKVGNSCSRTFSCGGGA